MSRLLIVGEAGEHPWLDGPSSRRLWRWFGVKSHAELAAMADLMNVIPTKGSTVVDPAHLGKVMAAAGEACRVFLVGKRAQRLIANVGTYQRFWCSEDGHYVGLPHPSGLNRQNNDLDNAFAQQFVAAFVSAAVKEEEECLSESGLS